ncbi:MAG: histidine phosphatase family protein [Deferribacterales bacterium]
MILYIVRHGKSIANQNRFVTGTTSDTLCDEGIRQAESMKIWFDNAQLKIDRYITSHWKRAQRTSQILWPEISWEIDPRIGETNGGKASEMILDDFLAQYEGFYLNPSNRYPDGESHIELNQRVINWLDDMLKTSHKNASIMLVTHSGPITCILQHLFGIEMDRFPFFKPLHVSLTSVSIPDNIKSNAKLLTFSLCSTDVLKNAIQADVNP